MFIHSLSKKILLLFLSIGIVITSLVTTQCSSTKPLKREIDIEETYKKEPSNKGKTVNEPTPSDVKEIKEQPSVTEIPEKNTTNTGKIEPINPQAPILTPQEAIRQIGQIRYREFYPVTTSGHPLIQLYDLTGDNQPELFLLTVKVKEKSHAKITYLSDYARLFSDNKQPIQFKLYLYGNRAGKLFLIKTYDLGERYVFKSFEQIRLNIRDKHTIIVAVGFQTQDGFEKTLFTFRGEKNFLPRLLSRFKIKENLSTKSHLTDIDDDGIIDIMVEEKGMEEGIGYETFLTWYRWRGYRFVEYSSTNVVRNLRGFLEKVKTLLIHGDYPELLQYSVDKTILKQLKNQNINDLKLLFKILGFDTYFDPVLSNPRKLFSSIKDVTFPEILENPFTKQEDGNWGFKISYRVSIQNGISFIAESKILMMKNPFGKRQFSFTILNRQ